MATLSEVLQARPSSKVFWCDCNIPDLLALPPGTSLIKSEAYADGELILQDKASCFPAHLLLGNNGTIPRETESVGRQDIMDACAAPGNKTTHLAAILAATTTDAIPAKGEVFACERDTLRSKVLQSMVRKAGASNVVILAKQDFLALDASNSRFAHVTHLLLDPSCSGSGILKREDIPVLALPRLPTLPNAKGQDRAKANSKKRKREQVIPAIENGNSGEVVDEED